MFIIEDFRHAPMRPLATAETPEEAARVVSALGIEGHACITSARQASIEETFRLADDHPRLMLDFEDAQESLDTARNDLTNTERRNYELEKRADDHFNDLEKLRSEVEALKSIAQPALPIPADAPRKTVSRARRKVS